VNASGYYRFVVNDVLKVFEYLLSLASLTLQDRRGPLGRLCLL
jgi:hypothetical protein